MSRRKRSHRVKYSPKMMKLIRANEGLPKYAWPGGYPMYYLAVDEYGENDETVCHKCATGHGHLADGDKIVDGDVNWEDGDLYCGACNERIESAYAEDGA